MPKTAAYDITVIAGDFYSEKFTFTDADGSPLALPVDGWAAQIRLSHNGPLVASFIIDTDQADDGILNLSLTSVDTRKIVKAYYDLTNFDEEFTYIRGIIKTEPDVTRE